MIWYILKEVHSLCSYLYYSWSVVQCLHHRWCRFTSVAVWEKYVQQFVPYLLLTYCWIHTYVELCVSVWLMRLSVCVCTLRIHGFFSLLGPIVNTPVIILAAFFRCFADRCPIFIWWQIAVTTNFHACNYGIISSKICECGISSMCIQTKVTHVCCGEKIICAWVSPWLHVCDRRIIICCEFREIWCRYMEMTHPVRLL